MTIDSYQYNRLAINMIDGNGFSSSDSPPFIPDLQVPPLYPMFLALIYWLSNKSIISAVFLQVIISSVFTILIIYKLGIKLFDRKSALIASFLLAIDPIDIVYSNKILTEPLFTFLLILGLYYFVLFFKEQKALFLILSGLILSLCALTRPISLYFPIVLIPFIIYALKGNIAKMFLKLLVFGLIVIICISPWFLRNYEITGELLFATVADGNLLYYRAASVEAEVTGENIESVRERFIEQYPLDLINKPEEYKANIRLARNIILRHPITYIKLWAKYLGRTLWFYNPTTFSSRFLTKWLTIIILASMLIVTYLAFVYGIYLSVKNKDYLELFFILTIIIYFIVLPAGYGTYQRFRIPVMPYIFLISGVGFSGIWSLFRGKQSYVV